MMPVGPEASNSKGSRGSRPASPRSARQRQILTNWSEAETRTVEPACLTRVWTVCPSALLFDTSQEALDDTQLDVGIEERTPHLGQGGLDALFVEFGECRLGDSSPRENRWTKLRTRLPPSTAQGALREPRFEPSFSGDAVVVPLSEARGRSSSVLVLRASTPPS